MLIWKSDLEMQRYYPAWDWLFAIFTRETTGDRLVFRECRYLPIESMYGIFTYTYTFAMKKTAKRR